MEVDKEKKKIKIIKAYGHDTNEWRDCDEDDVPFGEGWIGLRIGGFGKYCSPDSGFRAKFQRICGSYDPADRGFIPFWGPDFGF